MLQQVQVFNGLLGIVLTAIILPLSLGQDILIRNGTDFEKYWDFPVDPKLETDRKCSTLLLPPGIWCFKSTTTDPYYSFNASFNVHKHLCDVDKVSISINYFSYLTAASLRPVPNIFFIGLDPSKTGENDVEMDIESTNGNIYIYGTIVSAFGYFNFGQIKITHNGYPIGDPMCSLTTTTGTTTDETSDQSSTWGTTESPGYEETQPWPSTFSTTTEEESPTTVDFESTVSSTDPEPPDSTPEPEETQDPSTEFPTTEQETSTDSETSTDQTSSVSPSTEETSITSDITEINTTSESSTSEISTSESSTSKISTSESSTSESSTSKISTSESSTSESSTSKISTSESSTSESSTSESSTSESSVSESSTSSQTESSTFIPITNSPSPIISTTTPTSSTLVPNSSTEGNDGSLSQGGLSLFELIVYIILPSILVLSILVIGVSFAYFGRPPSLYFFGRRHRSYQSNDFGNERRQFNRNSTYNMDQISQTIPSSSPYPNISDSNNINGPWQEVTSRQALDPSYLPRIRKNL